MNIEEKREYDKLRARVYRKNNRNNRRKNDSVNIEHNRFTKYYTYLVGSS